MRLWQKKRRGRRQEGIFGRQQFRVAARPKLLPLVAGQKRRIGKKMVIIHLGVVLFMGVGTNLPHISFMGVLLFRMVGGLSTLAILKRRAWMLRQTSAGTMAILKRRPWSLRQTSAGTMAMLKRRAWALRQTSAGTMAMLKRRAWALRQPSVGTMAMLKRRAWALRQTSAGLATNSSWGNRTHRSRSRR